MIGKKIKQGIALGLSFFMAASLLPAIPASGAELSEAASTKPFLNHAGSLSVKDEWTTYDEPFFPNTAGSEIFRIPILITLQDGTLLAAADARWETNGDGGGLDSIASVSKDGGKTWQYSFPFFFPDSNGYAGSAATTIIDPGVVEGPDGTIYFIADVNPTGSTTLYKDIPTGTGYVEVNNGVDEGRFLALADNFDTSQTRPTDADLTSYPYYVSEFDENYKAEIRRRDDGSSTGYGVDEWYNLYSVAADGTFKNDLDPSHEVNGDKREIQQNCFYKDSMFHVYNIDYIWVITSKDGGQSWEHPRDITDQIKREGEHALLVSPGQGISTSTGDIVIGFYDHGGDEENASFVYSSDNGETWHRTEDVQRSENGGFWTSENEIVELWDGTLRMFLRNAQGQLCYADARKNSDGEYEVLSSVRTGIPSLTTSNGCNLSAISYSRPVNGKQLILVATPTGSSRANGKIFALLVDEENDNTVSLLDTFEIPGAKDGYVYSCLTEMEDGTIALLWEPNKWPVDSINFDKYSVLDIAPHAAVESVSVNVEIGKGETYTRTYAGESACDVTKRADEKIAEVTTEQKDGDKTVTIFGREGGYTEAVIDNVVYKIKVTDNTIYLVQDGGAYQIEEAEDYTDPTTDGIVDVAATTAEVVRLCDHTSNTASSLGSFSNAFNREIRIEEAEFTFTQSGSNWKIYNEAKQTYLGNSNATTYFQAGQAEMKVTFTTEGEVRICQTNDQRYLMFYFPNMDFNGNSGGYRDNYTDGSQELILFEKKDTASEDDIIPGYARASALKDGGKYLIGYIWTDDSVIILYPENGTANQTKLVKKTAVSAISITPKKLGETSIVVDGETYYFKVTEACQHETTEIRGAIPAGCMEEGYTGDTYCANPNCGMLLEAGESIAAIGSHDWGEPQITKPVTETEDGETVCVCTRDPMHKKMSVIYASEYLPLKEKYDDVADVLENMYGYYEADGIEKLQDIFDGQKAAVENLDATRSEMIDGTAALKAALEALEPKTSDALQNDLNTVVDTANTDKEDGGAGLPEQIWQDFLDALDTAEKTAVDADAETVWANICALQAAYDAVVEERDILNQAKDDLQAGINAVKTLKDTEESKYTPESWKLFITAYNNAVNAPEDADAATLERLLEALQTAEEGLKSAGSGQTSDDSQLSAGSGQTSDQGGQSSPDDPGQAIQKGYEESVKGIIYRVTDTSKKTVTAAGASVATVSIPQSVSIGGTSYQVTAIDAKAFRKSKTLKKLTIGTGITSIPAQAFSGCTKLTTVIIGKNVKTIGKKAFYNCKKLNKVTVKGTSKLSTLGTGSFKNTAKNITITLPKNLKKNKKIQTKIKKAGIKKIK